MRRPATTAIFHVLCVIAIIWIIPAESIAQGFVRTTISADVIGIRSATAGDFDGDGDVDIAACGHSGIVFWIETLPDRTRLARQLNVGGGTFRNLAVADFNQDGFDDIALAAYEQNLTYLLMSTGLGGNNAFLVDTLGTGQHGQFDICTDDVTGDGVADLIVAANRSNVIQIFVTQAGLPVLTAEVYLAQSNPLDVTTADIDGDGDRDIVVGTNSRGAYWIEQLSAVAWVAHQLADLSSECWVAAGDLNGDGRADIIVDENDLGRVLIMESTVGGFVQHVLATNIARPRGSELADFDMNGTLDIVGIGQDGSVFWWANNGNLDFTFHLLTPNYLNFGLSVGDIDQDGDLDFLVCEYQQSQLQFYENQMGTPAQIHGTVTALATGQSLDHIPVRIVESGVSAFTNSAGEYTILTAQGIYTLATHHVCWTDTSVAQVIANPDSPRTLNFQLRHPVIDVQVSSLNLIVHNRMSVSEQIPVENIGDGPLYVASVAEGNLAADPWLSVEPAELTIAPGERQFFNVAISPDTSDESIWDYNGRILLSTNTCPDSDIVISVIAYVLDADGRAVTPVEFGLTSVAPNPFNPSARIDYTLSHTGNVKLELYDITGRVARSLVSGVQSAGAHSVRLEGDGLATGVYLARLQSAGQSSVMKVVLLK